jgi:hypothetical protein
MHWRRYGCLLDEEIAVSERLNVEIEAYRECARRVMKRQRSLGSVPSK